MRFQADSVDGEAGRGLMMMMVVMMMMMMMMMMIVVIIIGAVMFMLGISITMTAMIAIIICPSQLTISLRGLF